jgi:hypothetical protein
LKHHNDTPDDTNGHGVADTDAERQSNQIIFAGRHVTIGDIVEIKQSKTLRGTLTFENNRWRAILDRAWFTGIRELCTCDMGINGTVLSRMFDLNTRLQSYEERNQLRLKLLHRLLSRLLVEIPWDRTRAYILRPIITTLDIALRSCELHEVAEGDPIVGTMLEHFQAKFPHVIHTLRNGKASQRTKRS